MMAPSPIYEPNSRPWLISSTAANHCHARSETGMTTLRRILVDLDATLYPSDPVWVDIMREAYDIELDPAELSDWHWYEQFGLSPDDFTALVQSHFHSSTRI